MPTSWAFATTQAANKNSPKPRLRGVNCQWLRGPATTENLLYHRCRFDVWRQLILYSPLVLGGCCERVFAIQIPDHWENTGNFTDFWLEMTKAAPAFGSKLNWLRTEFPSHQSRENLRASREPQGA
jgi:hypothetical protein